MFKKLEIAAITLMLLALTMSAFAQTQPEQKPQPETSKGRALLKQIGDTYKSLKSYHFEGRYTSTQQNESSGMKEEIKREEGFVFAAIKPDRSRVESKNPSFSAITITDGKTKWAYAPGANEYTKKTVEAGDTRPSPGSPMLDPLMSSRARSVLAGYERIADRVRDVRIIGEETLTAGEQRIICMVVEVDYLSVVVPNQTSQSSRKLWVDKARHVILRDNYVAKGKMSWGSTFETTWTYTFTMAKVNEQIPETLFTFTPPENAKEVAELNTPYRVTPPRRSNLLGKDALAFTLKDFGGNQTDLVRMKGKVVLLDFWASWCGPCVAELPHIENLHRDYKDKGLVVLGINNEEIEVARAFMKEKNYTFTSLFDDGKVVAGQYEVSGIPQVFLIGRDGKVKWHELGYGPGKEVGLREAVEKVLKGEEPSPKTDAPGETQAAPKTINVTGEVLKSSVIKKVQPPYPAEAKTEMPSGVVVVQVTVSEEGKVIDATILSGHPLLRNAALQAVRQWEFKPTMLSGTPVKVRSIISFNFTPQQ